jgi:hypothetical protein
MQVIIHNPRSIVITAIAHQGMVAPGSQLEDSAIILDSPSHALSKFVFRVLVTVQPFANKSSTDNLSNHERPGLYY